MTQRNQLAYLVLFLAAIGAALLPAQLGGQVVTADHDSMHGFAWKVQGSWKDVRAGTEISTGDPVLPGSLLTPVNDSGAHSLTLLMPDGQRVLSECFTVDDCSRGFRVPSLAETPPQFDAEMLDRMRSVIRRWATTAIGETGRSTPAQHDEIVATLLPNPNPDQGGPAQVKVQGLLGSMPSGSYTYTLGALGRPSSARRALPLQKASGSMFAIAGPGIYQIYIFDSLNMERLDLLVDAVKPGQTEIVANFAHAKKVLSEWNEQYYGWPIHDLLRAYLESFQEP